MGSLDLPLMLGQRGLHRTDDKRPDGVTMIPWEMGKHLLWDVTGVDALAPSRLNQSSLCNPGITATEAEARKIDNYREILDNGYIFQPVGLEVHGSLAESSEIFITRLCKMLCRSHDCQRAASFLKQRISMALQISNAAFVLGTVNVRVALKEIFYILFFFEKNLYHRSFKKILLVDYDSGWYEYFGVAVNRSNFSGRKDRGRTF